ncbi:hypothetical protein [uncultured Hymenobacter sp.]
MHYSSAKTGVQQVQGTIEQQRKQKQIAEEADQTFEKLMEKKK